MLKIDRKLYFLKIERFCFGNVNMAKLSERLLSTNITYHTNKKEGVIRSLNSKFFRDDSICMVNLLEIPRMVVFFVNYAIEMLRLFQERSCVLSS